MQTQARDDVGQRILSLETAHEALPPSLHFEDSFELEREDAPQVSDFIESLDESADTVDAIQAYMREVDMHPTPSPDENIELLNSLDRERTAILDLILSHPEALSRLASHVRAYIEGNGQTARFSLETMNSIAREEYRCRLSAFLEKLEDRARDDEIRETLIDLRLSHDIIFAVVSAWEGDSRHDTDALRRAKRHQDRMLRIRDTIVRRNQRLVIKVVRRIIANGNTFLDLIQEGNIGLLRAIEKFDRRRNIRFSTYAYFWIQSFVLRKLPEYERLIRLPAHAVEHARKIQEACERTGCHLPTSTNVRLVSQMTGLTERDVRCIMISIQGIASLNASQYEDGNDMIESLRDDAEDPFDLASRAHLMEHLDAALAALPERTAEVIRMRFGLDNGEEMTLNAIGQYFNISRERVRQILCEGFRLLRHPSLSGLLVPYLDEPPPLRRPFFFVK
jgi:RNA polymerase primary sigma factor